MEPSYGLYGIYYAGVVRAIEMYRCRVQVIYSCPKAPRIHNIRLSGQRPYYKMLLDYFDP